MSCIYEDIGKEVPIHGELRDILLESMDMLSESNCFIIAQEQINCCLHTDRGVYTILTEIKPLNKKKTEIYREFIEKLLKKK